MTRASASRATWSLYSTLYHGRLSLRVLRPVPRMSLLLSLNDDVLDLITAKLSATSINTSKAVNKRFLARGRRVLKTHAKFAARRAAYRLEGDMGDMLDCIE